MRKPASNSDVSKLDIQEFLVLAALVLKLSTFFGLPLGLPIGAIMIDMMEGYLIQGETMETVPGESESIL